MQITVTNFRLTVQYSLVPYIQFMAYQYSLLLVPTGIPTNAIPLKKQSLLNPDVAVSEKTLLATQRQGHAFYCG